MIRAPSPSTVTISPFSIEQHVAGLGEEGGDRRGEEGLPVAEPDDQRALLAGADERVGVVGVHRDERVVAAKVAEGARTAAVRSPS